MLYNHASLYLLYSDDLLTLGKKSSDRNGGHRNGKGQCASRRSDTVRRAIKVVSTNSYLSNFDLFVPVFTVSEILCARVCVLCTCVHFRRMQRQMSSRKTRKKYTNQTFCVCNLYNFTFSSYSFHNPPFHQPLFTYTV